MAITSAQIRLGITVVDTLDNLEGADSNTKTFNGFLLTKTLTSASTPVGSEMYSDTIAGTGAAVTYDLTALARNRGDTLDLTGKKLQMLSLSNTGSGTVTITERSDAPANPYNLMGSTEDIIVPTGCVADFFFNDTLADVAAGAKNININGTNGQNFNLVMVFG